MYLQSTIFAFFVKNITRKTCQKQRKFKANSSSDQKCMSCFIPSISIYQLKQFLVLCWSTASRNYGC